MHVIEYKGENVKQLLLIEDQMKDIRTAADAAESLGIEDIQVHKTVHGARSYLEDGLSGQKQLPDGIILDLDLGLESGFELLRYWHGTPGLSKIPVIVWTIVEEQREVCELFKVSHFVSKWQGADVLRKALEQVITPPSAS